MNTNTTSFSKSMIELVYAIRKHIDSDLKPSVKLANPDLLMELTHYFPHCKDVILKALIKELMELAGTEWQKRLISPDARREEKHILKAYRGTVSVEPRSVNSTPDIPRKSGKKMVYRGCVIES